MCQTCRGLEFSLASLERICDLKLSVCRVGHIKGFRNVCLVTLKAVPDWTDGSIEKFHRFLGYLCFKTNDEKRRMLSPSLMEIMIRIEAEEVPIFLNKCVCEKIFGGKSLGCA